MEKVQYMASAVDKDGKHVLLAPDVTIPHNAVKIEIGMYRKGESLVWEWVKTIKSVQLA